MAARINTNVVIWLLLWTVNNVGLTLMNKAVFSKVSFPYPFLLSSVHMACNSLGAAMLSYFLGVEKCPRTYKSYLFSIIFSLNIAVGNMSLKYVSVNFNQMMRSLVPALSIVLGKILYGRYISTQRIKAVIPVVIGVALATLGDKANITLWGLIVTTTCISLAALKVVSGGEMVRELSPLELLRQMSPPALVQCLLLSWWNGELFAAEDDGNKPSPNAWLLVTLTGIVSFTLNIASLQSNKLTSPLTLCIAANVKQVLMLILSTVFFNVTISQLNGIGIIIVLIGSANYSYISLKERISNNSDEKLVLPQINPSPQKTEKE